MHGPQCRNDGLRLCERERALARRDAQGRGFLVQGARPHVPLFATPRVFTLSLEGKPAANGNSDDVIAAQEPATELTAGAAAARVSSQTSLARLAVFGFIAFLFLIRLGAGSLWDNSEPTYGEIVKELFRTGDWLTLHLNYLPWDTHPPLWFWTAAGSVKLFGLDEFALRLPSAVFGLATAYATYRAGRRMYGDAAGLIAALAAGTSLEMIVLSRLAMMETALIFFMTVAFFWSY